MRPHPAEDDAAEPKRPRPTVIPKKREGWLERNEAEPHPPPPRFMILT